MNRVTALNVACRNAAPVVGTYICDPGFCEEGHGDGNPRNGSCHCWHESARRRLEWQGGPSANAAADRAAWNGLGERQRAAA
jgi:hypothetical protein